MVLVHVQVSNLLCSFVFLISSGSPICFLGLFCLFFLFCCLLFLCLFLVLLFRLVVFIPSILLFFIQSNLFSVSGRFLFAPRWACLRAAEQGGLTSAWRRLWSFGIATHGPSTTTNLPSKWHPPHPCSLLPSATSMESNTIHTAARLRRRSGCTWLDVGKCSDTAALQLSFHTPMNSCFSTPLAHVATTSLISSIVRV